MPIFECRALEKRYGAAMALDHIDLALEPGRIVGLLGPNGSGKSTVLKNIYKLAKPDSGEITLDGENVLAMSNKEMAKRGYMTVDKGSVTVNGVSLTVCNPTDDTFQVAIIPYTYEHTNFHTFQSGSIVNIEFDIIGKYLSRMMQFNN